jgi:hypothetical protein
MNTDDIVGALLALQRVRQGSVCEQDPVRVDLLNR